MRKQSNIYCISRCHIDTNVVPTSLSTCHRIPLVGGGIGFLSHWFSCPGFRTDDIDKLHKVLKRSRAPMNQAPEDDPDNVRAGVRSVRFQDLDGNLLQASSKSSELSEPALKVRDHFPHCESADHRRRLNQRMGFLYIKHIFMGL
jgi:hypothetical protein